jgi:hypothetical protein
MDNYDAQLTVLFGKMRRMISDFNRKDRKAITRKAGSAVGRRARQPGFPFFKDSKKKRKFRGKTYYPGNLRRSVRVLRGLGKVDSYVGPVIATASAGKESSEYGIGGVYDGWYGPAMIRRGIKISGQIYKRRILTAAMKSARPQALQAMKESARKALLARGRNRGLKTN